jgi:hypothetical protein
VQFLVVFRDRIFGFAYDRIFYTELATTGGYPENWNGANNVISMPSLGSRIINAIAHNDRIYIFTTDGVYQLYAIGSPSTWSISLITSTIRIKTRNNVALVRDIFIYTDQHSVYSFNGTSSQEIGEPIRHALTASNIDPDTFSIRSGPTGFSIHPYRDGFILALTYTSPSSGSWKYFASPIYYYFNGTSWSRIDFGSVNESIHTALIGIFKSKTLNVVSGVANKSEDVIVELRTNDLSPLTYDMHVYAVQETNRNMNRAPFAVFPIQLTTRQESLTEMVPKFTRLFQVMLNHKNSLRFVAWEVGSPQGDGTVTVVGDQITNMGATADVYTELVNISVEELERVDSIYVKIYLSWDVANSILDPTTTQFPSFRINSLMVNCNTDTRLIPDLRYTT